MDKWISRNSIPDVIFKKFNQVCKSMQNISEEKDGYWIKKLNQKVGAGTSVDITAVDIIDENNKFFVPYSFFKTIMKNDKLRMAQVDGYSMVPMLHPDDWVIFEKTKEFRGDGLYIIMYNDNLMVKILQKTPRGNLYIKSTNKDYESFELDEDTQNSCYIIGKVIKCII
ncbi:MAG: S24 family peptidase [Campylobacter sp.]|nr:S24 family peptidase [Campylobacter sp.]